MNIPCSSANAALRAAILLLALAAPALATVPAPDPAERPQLPPGAALAQRDGERVRPPGLGPFAYLREAKQILDYLAHWQFDQPGHPDHGGMIEAEAGPLGDVIQTDNTLEAIWCWSWWRATTGRTTFDGNVADAWTYSERWPAWTEEGAPNDNYYRAHNSAWGLGAAEMYEAATGDTTKRAYGRSCAQYIASHPLPLGNDPLNAMVAGWAAGSLYKWAVDHDDEARREAALQQARALRDWVELDPEARLAVDYWAMSGGTILWGLAASLAVEEGYVGRFWLHRHAGLSPAWSDWHNVSGYDWDSAWNVAYANGHFETRLAAGDPMEWAQGRETVDALLSWDADDDGGIMADSHDPLTEDMSWVSCYLVRFGLARRIGEPPARDAAPLRFVGLENGMTLQEGEALPLRLVIANHGLEDLADAPLTLGGDLPPQAASASVPFASTDTLDFGDWTPAGPGVQLLEAWTALPGDGHAANDTLRLRVRVLPTSPAGAPAIGPRPDAAARMTDSGWRVAGDGVDLPGHSLWRTAAGWLTLESVEGPLPAQVRLFDERGELRERWITPQAINLRLSSDGRQVAWFDGDSLRLAGDDAPAPLGRPGSPLFALGPDGRLVTQVFDDGRAWLLADDERALLPEPARGLAWRDGRPLVGLRRELLGWRDGRLLLVAALPAELLRLEAGPPAPRLTLRGRAGRDARLAEVELRDDGQLLLRSERWIADAFADGDADADGREHGPIPYPLDAQGDPAQPVGNNYAEMQNYGGEPYLHPGVDFLGADNEPVRAVAAGVVKAVLTTGGSNYWRVAVAPSLAADSLQGYLYAHLNQASITVAPGDEVQLGDQLGTLVPWGFADFTHLHFARVAADGVFWAGDWWTVDDPLRDLSDFVDGSPPVFEPTLGNDLFAFRSQPGVYQDPQALSGPLQIVAHVHDLCNSAWRLDVAALDWELRLPEGGALLAAGSALSRDLPLDVYLGSGFSTQALRTIYSVDGVCQSAGNYTQREYYQILTSDDGDGVLEAADSLLRLETALLPDGPCELTVRARDFRSNETAATMALHLTNGNGPVSLAVELDGSDARLSWSPAPGAVRYRVERCVTEPGAGPWITIAEPLEPAWNDGGALTLGAAWYRVRAVWQPVAADGARRIH